MEVRELSSTATGAAAAPPGELSGSLRHQISHSYQVVGRCGKGEHPSDSIRPPEARLALQGNGLHPAEHLFHSLALPLADRIALVPCRPLVNRTSPVGCVLRHVRRDLQTAHRLHKVLRVISAIRAQGGAQVSLRHHGSDLFGCVALGRPRR